MRRAVGVLPTGVLLALVLRACSPEVEDPTADCTDEGSPPPGEPGSAEVLLTVGNATGTSLLTVLLYADGWVLTLDGEDLGAVTALRASTFVTYYGEESATSVLAYALGQEEGSDRSRSDEASREVLQGIIAALDEAPVEGELLDVETRCG